MSNAPIRPNELVRQQPGGDAWALEHRELGSGLHMTDLDGHLSGALLADAPADRLFMEYACDAYANREKIVRGFAVIALFDRKETASAMESPANMRCLQFHCWLCRQLGRLQPEPPKFFYVIGKCAPWLMLEIDTSTGRPIKSYRYGVGRWRAVWGEAGLLRSREVLTKWLKGEHVDWHEEWQKKLAADPTFILPEDPSWWDDFARAMKEAPSW